ncbi:MAG: tetratricopeptide repeat protein, partial [Nostoc sp.]
AEINKKYPISNIQPPRKTQSYVVTDNKLYWQAVKDTTQAIFRCPSYIPAYINRGLAYKCLAEDSWNEIVEIQLCEKAIENYRLAIELANSSIDANKTFSAVAYYYRGLAYLYSCRRLEYLEDKADYSKASEDCIRAAKLFDELGWVNSADAAIFQIDIHVPF